jgi:branched-chain amino acid transport system permease protein
VAPTIISPFGNIEVIFAVLIGGAGNLYGAILGGVVFKLMSNYLATSITRWEMFLGALLLILVFGFRRGLTGYAHDLLLRLKPRPAVEA